MNYQEFQARTYEDVPFEVYDKIFEPMYTAANLDKDEFCRIIKPAVKPYADAAKKEREAQRFALVRIWSNRGRWGTCWELAVKFNYAVRRTEKYICDWETPCGEIPPIWAGAKELKGIASLSQRETEYIGIEHIYDRPQYA